MGLQLFLIKFMCPSLEKACVRARGGSAHSHFSQEEPLNTVKSQTCQTVCLSAASWKDFFRVLLTFKYPPPNAQGHSFLQLTKEPDTFQQEEIRMGLADAKSSTFTLFLRGKKMKLLFKFHNSQVWICAVSCIITKTPGKDISDPWFPPPSWHKVKTPHIENYSLEARPISNAKKKCMPHTHKHFSLLIQFPNLTAALTP